jgi:hypothetical protein
MSKLAGQHRELFRDDVYLFGVTVRLESIDREALASGCVVCGASGEQILYPDDSEVRIALRPYGHDAPRADDCHLVEGAHMRIAQDGFVLSADGERGMGECLFPRQMLGSALFADKVETLVYFLVAHAGRIPFHASAIMLGETALVLAGRSGVGKSSLALAANRSGIPVLSDDTVFVQTEPRLHVWAMPKAIHVFEKDAPNDGAHGKRLRNGRLKCALPIARPRHVADRARLCILTRGTRVALEEIGMDEAICALANAPEPGYEFYGKRTMTAAYALASTGCFRLTLSNNPTEAIAVLRERFWPADRANIRVTA